MSEKKPFALRLSPELFEAIQRIAEQEFRSVNGQIEYILSDYVRKRMKGGSSSEEKEAE